MSIASVSKLFTPKMESALQKVMRKGFKLQGQVPHTLLKEVPGADEFLKTVKTLGYNKVSLKGGIKGGKNTVTGLVQAYSGKTNIGYFAVGLDANAAKPIIQARGQITPIKGGERIKFNMLADGNKKLLDPLDAAAEYSAKKGKIICNIDDGAIRGHFDGDAKTIFDLAERYNPGIADKLRNELNRAQIEWTKLFTPKQAPKAKKPAIPKLKKVKFMDDSAKLSDTYKTKIQKVEDSNLKEIKDFKSKK